MEASQIEEPFLEERGCAENLQPPPLRCQSPAISLKVLANVTGSLRSGNFLSLVRHITVLVFLMIATPHELCHRSRGSTGCRVNDTC